MSCDSGIIISNVFLGHNLPRGLKFLFLEEFFFNGIIYFIGKGRITIPCRLIYKKETPWQTSA